MNNHCNSEKVRHPDPLLYDTVLKISEAEGCKIGKALWQEIKDKFPAEERYEILAPGIGTGRFVIPFLLAIPDEDRHKVQVYAIEKDLNMSSYLREKLRELKLQELVDLREVDFEKDVIEDDIERFHACFAFFIFHHLKDPIKGVDKMVSFLKPDGLFFFSEEQGDKELWDTNFQHINYKELKEIVNDEARLSFVTSAFSFSRELARQGLLRYPLISAGDNIATIDYLEEKGLTNLWHNNNKQEFSFYQDLEKDEWFAAIREGMFSFLPGSVATEYQKVIDHTEEKLPHSQFAIKNRLQIYAFQKPLQPTNKALTVTDSNKLLSRIKQSHVLRFAQRIIDEHIYVDENLFQNELNNRLQVMESECFFEKSVFVYLSSWALHKGRDGEWLDKVPVWISKVNDSDDSGCPWHFIATQFLYLLLSGKDVELSNFKITDFVLHDMPDKCILAVKYFDNCLSRWEVNFDRFGKVEKITIPCSKGLVSLLTPFLEDITSTVEYLKDRISRDIRKTKKGWTMSLKKLLDPDLLDGSPFNTEPIRHKMKEVANDAEFKIAIAEGKKFFEDISKFTGRKSWGFPENQLTKLFIALLYTGLVGSFDEKSKWRHIYYIPGATHSEALLHDEKEHSSFCWMMLCDKEILETEERYLRLIANLYGRADSTWSQTEKVKLDFMEHSRRIAIISILVDSFAHNIAAHSLSAMVWFLKQQRKKQIDFDLPYDICKKKFSDLKKGIENSAEKQHLLDLIKEIDNNFVKNAPMEGSVQYAQYLTHKAAFWSGVTRDFECGGEIKTWYDVIKDFTENAIFLGTIAHAEGIHKVRIKVGCGKEKVSDQKTEDFEVEEFDVTAQGSNKSVKFCNGGEFKKTYWKNLDQDKWKLFLPNGIVGLHALYTIFENTLRNIKHADPDELEKAKTEGIEFNIFIESVNKKHFNTTIWLGNKTRIIEEEKDNDGNDVFVEEEIDKLLRKPVVTENGTPRMGGNSQDKICASMLYNNVFSKVDVNNQDNPNRTYPWIHVKRDPANGQELGVIKRSFYVWKGADVVEIIPDTATSEDEEKTTSAISSEDEKKIVKVKIKVSELEYENPARFKFVIVPKSKEYSGLESGEYKQGSKGDLAKKGIVRIMDELECSGKDLGSLYKAWNKKWIKADRNVVTVLGNEIAINPKKETETETAFTVFYDNARWNYNDSDESLGCYFSELNKNRSFINGKNYFTISFRHRADSGSAKDALEWAGHCDFMKRFKSSGSYIVKDMRNAFIETLLTNIEIYDNRIFNRVESRKKKDLFAKKLFLHVCDENTENATLMKKSKDSKANFVIIHLSYIKSLGYNDDNINKFIEEYLEEFLSDNSKLVITTGRGRDEWHNHLYKNYKPNVLFKPIDSLLAAVENGLIDRDDFQVKYNLVKVLFGS